MTIRAEQHDFLVRLWFEDNGIGIAPDMQTRVFGTFRRLSTGYEGTGIGLALVRRVVERMVAAWERSRSPVPAVASGSN